MSHDHPVIVLKVGTSSLINMNTGAVRLSAMARVVETSVRLTAAGFRVVVVSSGAVGLGCARLGLTEKPSSTAQKQAAAAVGQVRLMTLYDEQFSALGHRCAQVLLTYDTFGDRNQYLNARNTFQELLSMGVIPIVNENDTVATQVIRVGDNDSLSALVAAMIGARWLFLLTDVDALFDCNPMEHADASPFRVVAMPYVQHLRKQMLLGVPRLMLTENVAEYAPGAADAHLSVSTDAAQGKAGSKFGTGGMVTKLKAAQLGTAAGVVVVITRTDNIERITGMLEGEVPEHARPRAATATPLAGALPVTPLSTPAAVFEAMRAVPPTLFADAELGTTFMPAAKPVTGRKRWILSLAIDGVIVLDPGAVAAVTAAHKSLFPAGILAVHGDFETHDAVSLVAEDGHEVARALVNYNAEECRKLCGNASKDDIAAVLGYFGAEAVAERYNIVVLTDCHDPLDTDAPTAAASSDGTGAP